jgi:integrase/recombinase XerD
LIFEWLDSVRANGRSPKTLADYQDKLFKFWWWWTYHSRYAETLGRHPRFVTRKEARAFAAYLREPNLARWGITEPTNNKQRAELAPASIAGYGRTVKTFFNWLVVEEHIPTSPFTRGVNFTNHRQQDRIVKSVETGDLKRIFDYLMEPHRQGTFPGRRNLAMLALLLDSGIRRGELLSMQLAEGELDLVRNRCVVQGKTGRRFAMFGTACCEALKAYLKLRNQVPADTKALWITEDGEPLSYYGFGTLISRLEKGSGVDFHTHLLRHTFASTLARQGIDPFTLKELLGHTSINTTQIYVRQNPERLAEAYVPRSPLKELTEISRPLKRRAGRPRIEH